MLELIVFILGSLGILILSLRSFINPLSHGFPRFFAFEAILGLVVLNAHGWFDRPFSLPQLVSWALFLDAVVLAIHAFWTFTRYGKPDRSIQDPNRLSIEKTTHLITEGPYRFIRHPMYTSLLCLAWGIFLKQTTLTSGLLVLVASLALLITAIFEEKENVQIFGDGYTRYMHRTKRFIPFVF